ncbi:hypothetical protein M8C21_030211 [Ambrosia artemisiifolia]|uniref:Uncharacterized protein n=1 Tax=Ambrosia artemisiifolia TaxID=4212 RepID=A0AAD5CEW3_AMBAR|nr:hypothetical protein M8C21_030211 [Ambrosia artemisiifolia]
MCLEGKESTKIQDHTNSTSKRSIRRFKVMPPIRLGKGKASKPEITTS